MTFICSGGQRNAWSQRGKCSECLTIAHSVQCYTSFLSYSEDKCFICRCGIRAPKTAGEINFRYQIVQSKDPAWHKVITQADQHSSVLVKKKTLHLST